MSQMITKFWDFIDRLNEDGYPTAIPEQMAKRMELMEAEILRLHKELNSSETEE